MVWGMKDKKLSQYFSRMGKKSAQARMKKITPAERKRIATLAANARWSKRKGESC
jgi:hypothetical protein